MSGRTPEATSPQYCEIFTFSGPRDEMRIPSSIVYMCVRGRDRRFVIDEGEREITLELREGVLFAPQSSERSDFWLNRIVNVMLQPIPAEFFAKENPPTSIRVEREYHSPVIVSLLRQAARVR